MKTFNQFINEGLEYTDFFGKQVSHNEALLSRVKGYLIDILQEENQVSEKDFTRMDEIMKEAKDFVQKDTTIIDEATKYYESNRRLKLLAELLYEKMKSNETIR